MKVTYYLEVVSSWCYWAEPAWAELKQRYAGRAEFGWKIAQMPAEAYPASRAQLDWFYRRSGTITRSPFMLNSGWWEPGIKQWVVPNLIAEAAKDFEVTDDRVRLALAQAAEREGKKVGRWEVAVPIAAAAAGLEPGALLKRAKSDPVKARVHASSREFHDLQVSQRPAFLFENQIGDRAVFSGLVKIEPLAAAMEALLADEAAYASYSVHHRGPPAK
ncbi:MAG TPA: disulfide bond formation protein DsbA [Verrucomicrobiae bacterium]|nr:disulfide bond formation protein DsbA [Verrucomicrobiae bacterium]